MEVILHLTFVRFRNFREACAKANVKADVRTLKLDEVDGVFAIQRLKHSFLACYFAILEL